MLPIITNLSAFRLIQSLGNPILWSLPELPKISPVLSEIIDLVVLIPFRICLNALKSFYGDEKQSDNHSMTMKTDKDFYDRFSDCQKYEIRFLNPFVAAIDDLIASKEWEKLSESQKDEIETLRIDMFNRKYYDLQKYTDPQEEKSRRWSNTNVFESFREQIFNMIKFSPTSESRQVFIDLLRKHFADQKITPYALRLPIMAVRDTVIRLDQWDALSEEKKHQIHTLYNEFQKLGYIDARFHLGPSQSARMTSKQRKDRQVVFNKVIAIELAIKDILLPQSEREKIEKQRDIEASNALLAQLRRQWADTTCAFGKKLQSKRDNAEKRQIKAMEAEYLAAKRDVREGFLPVAIVKSKILQRVKYRPEAIDILSFDFRKVTRPENFQTALKQLLDEARIKQHGDQMIALYDY